MADKTLSDAVQVVYETVVGDADIKAYCQAEFSGFPQVIIGTDPEDPPEASEIPTVFITPGGRGRTDDFAYFRHGMRVCAVIYYKSKTVSDVLEQIDGFGKIDGLMNLIDAKVVQALQQNQIAVFPGEGEDDQVAYPFVKAYLPYTIQVRATLPNL